MLRKLVSLLLLFTVLGLALPAAAAAPKPVIIDTDMVTDDWMAILLTLKNPDFSVKAITVTGTGWATCDAGVRIALGLVALVQAGDIPVSCWRETPLFGENVIPPDWRITLEAANALELPEGGSPSELNAVDLFASTLQASAEKVTVLAIGPLTNVGQALETTPALVDKIERIYVMGGAVDVPGSGVTDENSTAEWNIYGDAHAARLVFESGAPITLIPLDATNDVPLTPEFMTKLEADQRTPEAQFIYKALSGNMDSINSGSYYFWDPLAAAVMADSQFVTLTPRTVTVVDVPGAENGRTKPVGNGPQIEVASQPDVAAFEAWFLNRLCGCNVVYNPQSS